MWLLTCPVGTGTEWTPVPTVGAEGVYSGMKALGLRVAPASAWIWPSAIWEITPTGAEEMMFAGVEEDGEEPEPAWAPKWGEYWKAPLGMLMIRMP